MGPRLYRLQHWLLTLDRGNGDHGIYIHMGAGGNTITDNVISGNGQYGITISNSDATTISGNGIGVGANRVDALGNDSSGIYLGADTDDTVVGPDNVIAYNGIFGLYVSGAGGASLGNQITQNSIFTNTAGGNGELAAPDIDATTSGSIHIAGTACAGCTVEVFSDASEYKTQGEVYLGQTTADGSGAFTLILATSYLTRPYVTATATDASNNTSQFSDGFEATVPVLDEYIYLPLVLRNGST